jgi:hypothetical protein
VALDAVAYELAVVERMCGKEGRHELIISPGDISEVDALFALAKYAKTGPDVLNVMNYTAHLCFPKTPNYRSTVE